MKALFDSLTWEQISDDTGGVIQVRVRAFMPFAFTPAFRFCAFVPFVPCHRTASRQHAATACTWRAHPMLARHDRSSLADNTSLGVLLNVLFDQFSPACCCGFVMCF